MSKLQQFVEGAYITLMVLFFGAIALLSLVVLFGMVS
jgi:hypothetical protein